MLIPAYGIRGAAAASSLSYIVTAALTLIVFHRLSDRGLRETLIIRPIRHPGAGRRDSRA